MNITKNMSANKKLFIVISLLVGIILGWTSSVCLSDFSFLTLENNINLSDVASIVVNILIASFVVYYIDKGLQNNRVEKDFYIAELDSILAIFRSVGDRCATSDKLPFPITVYDIERAKKTFNQVLKLICERDKVFCQKHRKEHINAFFCKVRKLNSLLTDSEYMKDDPSFENVRIDNGEIYLNSTIRPLIDTTLSSLKENIIRLKISINAIL